PHPDGIRRRRRRRGGPRRPVPAPPPVEVPNPMIRRSSTSTTCSPTSSSCTRSTTPRSRERRLVNAWPLPPRSSRVKPRAGGGRGRSRGRRPNERAGWPDDRGHRVSAREAYLRAVTYSYHACLAIPVDDPAFRAGVEHYRSLFQRLAAPLPGHTPPCVLPAAGLQRRAAPHGRHR